AALGGDDLRDHRDHRGEAGIVHRGDAVADEQTFVAAVLEHVDEAAGDLVELLLEGGRDVVAYLQERRDRPLGAGVAARAGLHGDTFYIDLVAGDGGGIGHGGREGDGAR